MKKKTAPGKKSVTWMSSRATTEGRDLDLMVLALVGLLVVLIAALSSTAMAVGEWQFALLFRASILDVFYRGLLNQFIKCHGHARGYLLKGV